MNTGTLFTPGWRVLSDACGTATLEERVIQVLGDIVQSRGGFLWEATPEGVLFPRSRYGRTGVEWPLVQCSDPIIRYMIRHEWIINRGDSFPELPDWFADYPEAWLLIPLLLPDNRLRGLVLLTSAPHGVAWNRDTIERLKTSSRLAASYLALQDAGRALTIARRFETLNRLSSFVVHDLRNLLTQLSLLLGNFRQHRHHKRFGEDVIITLDHVVRRMNRLVTQSRHPLNEPCQPECIELDTFIRQLIQYRVIPTPCPVYVPPRATLRVQACRERLSAAVGHIIKNAQEAAGPTGRVSIRCRHTPTQPIVISVEDNGTGMSETFIRTRLFMPFETTKGLSGMGIGACESREYVRTLGGELEVESTPGQGTTVHISLPEFTGSDQHEALDPMVKAA